MPPTLKTLAMTGMAVTCWACSDKKRSWLAWKVIANSTEKAITPDEEIYEKHFYYKWLSYIHVDIDRSVDMALSKTIIWPGFRV